MNRQELYDKIDACNSCELHKLTANEKRLKPWGYEKSMFMMIGQCPSSVIDEDSSEFFFHYSNTNPTFTKNYNLLESMFKKVGLDFHTMWKTNLQKCRPENNDDKNYLEMETCRDQILRDEIEFVGSKVIFLLGGAVQKQMGLDDRARGKMTYSEEFKCYFIPIYHVSYCTRGGITEEEYINQLDHLKTDLKEVRDLTFVNLHHHNQFSVRDGYGTETQITKRLQELRSPGFALTNHGNINGHYRQYKESNAVGLKPVFGTEFYYNKNRNEIMEILQNEDKKDKEQNARRVELGKETYHITVLAKNEEGYKNLIRINNKAVMESFYRFPLIDFELLESARGSIYVFSGCAGAYIPQYLIGLDDTPAYEEAELFQATFGEDFYIELMSSQYEKQKEINAKLLGMSDEMGIEYVVTNDAHYIYPEDAKIHEMLLLSRNNATYEDLNDESKNVWVFTDQDYFIKSAQDIRENIDVIPENRIDKAIENVNDLFATIKYFEIDDSIKMPKVSDDSVKELKSLMIKGLEKRGIKPDDAIFRRMKEELNVIIDTGYIDYFLILADVVRYAKDKYGRYCIGPGRGSAVSSLINYLLEITDVNPLKYDFMMFSRFLDRARKDDPDIDTDFDPRIRDDILNYVTEKYGADQVMSIGNYGTNKAKSSIADVFRAYNVDYRDVLNATKSLDGDKDVENKTLSDIRDRHPKIDALIKLHPDSHYIIEGIRDQIRSIGTHAAGIVLSGINLIENVPLSRTSSKKFVTANTEGGDYHELSEMGFVKYDFLSLSCIALINETNKLIEAKTGSEIDWDKMEDHEDDHTEIYALTHKGDSYGIFQYSSSLAVDFLKKMQPTTFNEFIAASGLLRPGPLDQNMHTEYSDRLNKKKRYKIHPALQDILGPTFGVIVYQEQIMRICAELAGFTAEENNVFRKALVKYEKSEAHEKVRRAKVKSFSDKLIAGLEDHMSLKEAHELWGLIESFARYGFNYSHCHSYGVLSWRQLYQKYFYPVEFYCAMLNVEMIDHIPMIIRNMILFPAREFKNGEVKSEFSIKLNKPDLRKMNYDFQICDDGKSIDYGIGKIKFLSRDSFDVLENNLTSKDMADFETLIKVKYDKPGRTGNINRSLVLGKKVFQSLVYSGALDYLNIERNEMIDFYNETHKSTVKRITGKKGVEETENDYCGVSFDKLQRLPKIREAVEEILTDDLRSFYETGSPRTMDAIADYVEVIEKKDRVSKNNRKYSLYKVANLYDIFYPIMSWSSELNSSIKKGDEFVGLFKKSNEFVNILKVLQTVEEE